MSDRATKLYDAFIEAYDDIDGVQDLLEALVIDCPGATDQEMLDYVIEVVAGNYDEAPDLDDAVADFSSSFGCKVLENSHP